MMRKAGGSDIVRNHKYRGKGIILLAAVAAAGWIGTGGTAVLAQSGAEGRIHSRGRVQYEQAVFDSADLQDIRAYIDEQKRAAAGTLIQLGTRFRQQPEGFAYDRNPDVLPEEIDTGQLDWEMLIHAVAQSQTVPTGLTVLNPEAAMQIEGVEERTDYYETAIEDNISRGMAAWADGRLLLGNGADNDKAYRKGTEDGEGGNVPENFYPIYTADATPVEIRHMHVGNPEKKDGVSGCYENSHTTKTEVTTCGAQLVKTDVTWYPNPDEPEGGSWHGGQYVCRYHDGLYDSPGTCPHEDKKTVTKWKHEVICGLEEKLYAKLTVRGTDTDYYDRAILLEAVLEEEEACDHLTWQEGDRLIWMDAEGNVLGTGSSYTACEAGVYRCCLNITNEDLNCREICVTVRKTGLVTRGN